MCFTIILGDPGAVSAGGKKAKRARKKIRRRKVKNESRSPWDSSLNGPVPKPFKILASDWAQKYFLCPIRGKDFKWFRNWSVKRRIPGAPTFVLDFSSPDFFPRPFSLFPARTNCPWVSEDDCEAHLLESYCKESNISDENWLRYLFSLYLMKTWLSIWRHRAPVWVSIPAKIQTCCC